MAPPTGQQRAQIAPEPVPAVWTVASHEALDGVIRVTALRVQAPAAVANSQFHAHDP